jgi:glycosyltransferase involved in cell wall biosynthesis
MTTPLVSVVTPSYNQAAYIRDSIRSVRRQSHRPVEHIIVDGGSTDGTVDILQRAAAESETEPGYELRFSSGPDEGQSDAINTGFDRAQGAIVGWLNSDDVYFDVDVFSRVVDYFDSIDAEVIYGDIAYINENSTVQEVNVRPDFSSEILTYRSTVAQPAAFFDRRVLAEYRLNPEYHYTMDWELWLRLAAEFEFAHVPDVLAGFRRHEEQKTVDQEAFESEFQQLRDAYDLPAGREGRNLIDDVLTVEIRRYIESLRRSYDLHENPRELAFQGLLAPLPTMLAAAGPSRDDVEKSLQRWVGDAAGQHR